MHLSDFDFSNYDYTTEPDAPEQKKKEEAPWSEILTSLPENVWDAFAMGAGGAVQAIEEMSPASLASSVPASVGFLMKPIDMAAEAMGYGPDKSLGDKSLSEKMFDYSKQIEQGAPDWAKTSIREGEKALGMAEGLGEAAYGEWSEEAKRDRPDLNPGSLKSNVMGILQNVALNAPGMAAAAVTKKPMVALAPMGLQSGGQQYGDIRKEAPDLPVGEALAGGALSGATEILTEKIPLDELIKPEYSFGKRILMQMALDVPGEEVATVIQEGVISKATTNPGMTWGQFVQSMEDTAIQSIGAAGMQGTIAHGIVKWADQQKQTFDKEKESGMVPATGEDGSILTKALVTKGTIQDVQTALRPENAKLWTPQERRILEDHMVRLQATESPSAKIEKAVKDLNEGRATSEDLIDTLAGQMDNIGTVLRGEDLGVEARKVRYDDRQTGFDFGADGLPLFNPQVHTGQGEIVQPGANGEAVKSSTITGSYGEQETAMEKRTREQIEDTHDVPINPKVAPLVTALNKADIPTDLSGDLYGRGVIYTDLPGGSYVKGELVEGTDQYEKLLQDATLPKGWAIVPADMTGSTGFIDGKEKPFNGPRSTKTRLIKKGDTVSPQEIAQVVAAIKTAMDSSTTEAQALELSHRSHTKLKGDAPHFDAFYGDKEFSDTFKDDFGQHEYKLTIPKEIAKNIRNLEDGSPEAAEILTDILRTKYPNDDGITPDYIKSLQQGDPDSHAEFYDVWTDKNDVLPVIRKRHLSGLAYRGEYILTKETIKASHEATSNPSASTQPTKGKGHKTPDVSKIVTEQYEPYSQKNPWKGGNYNWKRVDRSQIGKVIKDVPELDYDDYTINENAAYGQVEVTILPPHDAKARKDLGIDINEKTKTAITDNFELAPDLRGKGLGTKLWKKIEDDARKHGAERMEIWHVESDAHEFWKKMGFKPIAGGSEDSRTWTKEKADFLTVKKPFVAAKTTEDTPIVQRLLDIKAKIGTISTRNEGAEIDKSISKEIYDAVAVHDNSLAYHLMKKAEQGIPAAILINNGKAGIKDTMSRSQVKDLNEALDRAIARLRKAFPSTRETTAVESPKGEYGDENKVTHLVTQPVRDRYKKFQGDMKDLLKKKMEKVAAYDGWKWEIGDRVKSKKTGKIWEVTAKSWNDHMDVPSYFMQTRGQKDGEDHAMFYAEPSHDAFIHLNGRLSSIKEADAEYGEEMSDSDAQVLLDYLAAEKKNKKDSFEKKNKKDSFYSNTEDILNKQTETAMPPAEWKKRIEAWGQKFAGIREEIKWLGILEFIDHHMGDKKISKADLQNQIDESKKGWLQQAYEPDTRWSSRNLPGGIPGSEQMWTYSRPGGKVGDKLKDNVVTRKLTREDLQNPNFDHTTLGPMQDEIRSGSIQAGDWGHFDRVIKWDELGGGHEVLEPLWATRFSDAATKEQSRQELVAILQDLEDDRFLAPLDSATYRSPHFASKPNVLLHIRTQKMVDKDGRVGLLAETIQSDWHQEGRDKGYLTGQKISPEEFYDKILGNRDRLSQVIGMAYPYRLTNEEAYNVADRLMGGSRKYADLEEDAIDLLMWEDDEIARFKEVLKREYDFDLKHDEGVPDAPFKDTWHEQGLKRLIDIAAKDPEVEWIGWTPGEAQAERWGKGEKRYINDVEYVERGGGEYSIDVQWETFPQDDFSSYRVRNFVGTLDQIKDKWGREVADAIRNKEGLIDEDSDTKFAYGIAPIRKTVSAGGEYLKLLYDKKLPKFADKYVKKWGTKVTTAQVDAGEYKVMKDSHTPPYRLERRDSPDILSRHNTAAEAWDMAERLGGQNIHAITITPQMREEVNQKGQAFYEPQATYAEKAIGALGKAVDLFTARRLPGAGLFNRSKQGNDRNAAGVQEKETRHHTVGKLIDDLKELKMVRLRGAEAKTWGDVYDALRITRNKNVEILQVLYIGETSGKILYNEACSSRLPGAVNLASAAILASQIHATTMTLKRISGEGVKVAIAHNHPSGDVIASEPDKAMTSAVASLLNKKYQVPFDGHIILDHNMYNIINAEGETWIHRLRNVTAEHAEDPLLTIPIPHERLGKAITRQQDIAAIAKDINRGKKYFTLLMRSGTKVRGIVNIELGVLKNTRQAQEYIKNLMINHGAQDAFVYRDTFSDKEIDTLIGLVKGNTIRNAVWEEKKGTQNLQSMGIRPDSNRQFGRDISDFQGKWLGEDNPEGLRERETPYRADEATSIIETAKANGTYLKAPNGQPTKLNPEQWVQVRTKAFQKWFGGSQVVDENGDPLVVYHGTKADFDTFDSAKDRGDGEGFFFTMDKAYADTYGRKIMAAYLSIKKPYTLTAAQWSIDGKTPEELRRDYDGVCIYRFNDEEDTADVWVAFSPNQIKSATANNGNFDTNEDSILRDQDAPYGSGNKDYVKVYRGLTGREIQGEPLLVTTDKATAQSHGKIIIEAYVQRSKLTSGPEELAFYDGKVPPDKIGIIEALAEEKDLIPENEFGRVSDKEAPYGEDMGEPPIDNEDDSFDFGANIDEETIDADPESYISTDFADHLDGYLGALNGLVFQGEAGHKGIDKEGEAVSWNSTYPEFMQDQGWTAKEVLSALSHAQKGEELTPKQREIVEAAINQAVDMFYEDLSHWDMTPSQIGKAEASIQKATDALLKRYYTNQATLRTEKEKIDRATMVTKSKYQWEQEKAKAEAKGWEKGAAGIKAVTTPAIEKLQAELEYMTKQRDRQIGKATKALESLKSTTQESQDKEAETLKEIRKLNSEIKRVRKSLDLERAKAKNPQPPKKSRKSIIRITTGMNLDDEITISEYKLLKNQLQREAIAANKAMREGNKQGLLTARARYRVLMDNLRARRDARKEVNKILKDLKKVSKQTAQMTPEYQKIIDDTLGPFSFSGMTDATRTKLEGLRAALVNNEEMDLPDAVIESLSRLDKTPLRNLDLTSLRNIHMAVMHFAALGKRGPQMILSQKKVTRDFILDQSIKGMRPAKQVATEMDATYSSGKEAKARLATLKNLYTVHLDTYDNIIESIAGQDGMAYRVLYREIKQGSNERDKVAYSLEDEFMEAQEAFQKRHPEIKNIAGWLNEEVTFAGIKMQRNLAISLYRGFYDPDFQRSIVENGFGLWGNQDQNNPNKIYKLPDDLYASAISKMTNVEKEYGDLALPTIERSGDLLAAKFLEINGYAMPRIEGGIYWRKEVMASERAKDEELELQKERFGRPHVFKGMTKQRTGSSAAVWVKPFTVSVREMHQRAADFVGLEEAMSNASWLLYNKQFSAAMEERYGKPVWREIEKGLKDIAQISDPGAKTDMERFFRWLRNKSTIYALAANYGTALKQLNGSLNYMVYVPPGYLTQAISTYSKDPMAVKKLHREMSVEYRRRRESGYSQDIGNVLSSLNQQGREATITEKIGQKGMLPLQYVDIFGVDLGMLASTYQAMDCFKNGEMTDHMRMALDLTDAQVAKMTPAEKMQLAYRWAEFVTERTQGQNLPEHMSGWQRGTELEKQMSMFFGELQKNLAGFARAYRAVERGEPGAKALLTKTILLYAILGVLIDSGVNELRNWLRGRKGDAWWAALLKSYTGYLPVIREIASSVIDYSQGKVYGGGGGDTPYARIQNMAVKPATSLAATMTAKTPKKQRENAWKLAKSMMDLVSLMLGVPWPAMQEPYKILTRDETKRKEHKNR